MHPRATPIKEPSRPLGGVAVRRGFEARLAGQKHYADSRRRVTRLDEVNDIRDKAEAMAAYARQAKDSELIQYATEIKVRAERRCGELLSVTVQHGGDRKTESRSNSPTLNEMGLTKDESSRYQQLAAMPTEHFETAVATAKATAGEVTTAFMLREAKKQSQPVPLDSPSVPRDGHVTNGIVIWLEVAYG